MSCFYLFCAIADFVISMNFLVGLGCYNVMLFIFPMQCFSRGMYTHDTMIDSVPRPCSLKELTQYSILGLLYSELEKNHGNWNLIVTPRSVVWCGMVPF